MKKKIVFMGSDKMGLPVLNLLKGGAEYELVGVVSQPDRKSGRGQKVQANEVSMWAREQGIELRQPEKPGEETREWLVEMSCDLVVVMAYGHILKEDLLKAPKRGMINLHISLLPKYRGASPVEAAIANGDKVVGVTLMEIVRKMDAGGMMDKEEVIVDEGDTSEMVREKCGEAGAILLERNIKRLLEGNVVFNPQEESLVTYTRKIEKVDGWLDFRAGARELVNRVRAMTPWPGGYFKYGEDILKIGVCEKSEEMGEIGVVVEADDEGLCVGTGKGLLVIKSLQRPGGKMLSIGEFLRGYRIGVGSVLEGNSEGMKPLESKEPFRR